MPIDEIDISTLRKIPCLISGKKSHTITKGVLPNSSIIWYDKEMENPETARLEILAQEFFRLIIPTQPETRIAKNPNTKTFHILSEEVPGYRPLPVYQKSEFTKGTYFGLGQVTFLAAYLQEIDLKNNNICLNIKNQVIKIDGDWCFAGIKADSYSHEPKALSAELLSNLPYLHGVYAHNWLDIIQEEISCDPSNIIDPSLSNAPHFRNEVNQAVLKTLLVSNNYIKRFVDTFITIGSSADRFITFLQERRKELKAIAEKDVSFQAYLLSQNAKNDIRDQLLHMKRFVVHGKQPIIPATEHAKLENDYAELVAELHTPPDTSIPKPVIRLYGSPSSGNCYEDINTGICVIETGDAFTFMNMQGAFVSLTKEHQKLLLQEVHAFKMAIMQKRHASSQALLAIRSMKAYFDDLNLSIDIKHRFDRNIELIEEHRKMIDPQWDQQQAIGIIETKKAELRKAANIRIIDVVIANHEIERTVEQINNIKVSFLDQFILTDINNRRSLLLEQTKRLVNTTKLDNAQKKLHLFSHAVPIQIAFSDKQHQINQQADAQIIAIKQNEKLKERIHQTVSAINNIQVVFTSINSREEVHDYQRRLLSQVDALIQNNNFTQPQQNITPFSLYPDIHNASIRKRQEINQQVSRLNERFEILSEIHFDDHLNEFIKKTAEMSDKAVTSLFYEPAARKTQEFCNTLKQARSEFLHQQGPIMLAKIQLKNDCEFAIESLRPEVEEHREWAGAFAKFLLDLVSLLTFGLMKNQLGLFARTDTTKKLDNFHETAINVLVR